VQNWKFGLGRRNLNVFQFVNLKKIKNDIGPFGRSGTDDHQLYFLGGLMCF